MKNTKRAISAAMAAAMAFSAMGAFSASAAEKYGDGTKFAVLGDSIAQGYGLEDTEYTYGQILADYYAGSVENYAVSGYDTDDTLAQVKALSGEQKDYLAKADTVIISIGANDMVHYAAKYLLNMAANIDALNTGYTKDDIPEKPGFFDLTKMLNKSKLAEFAKDKGNALMLADEFATLRLHLIATDSTQNAANYDKVIAKQIIPNIEAIVAEIKTVNPKANIIIQNLYNPLQLQEEFEKANYADQKTLMTQLKQLFTKVIERYNDQLKTIKGVTVADVYTDISSYELTDSGKELRYGWYFTKIQNDVKHLDIHPTQAGHVAIASTIINTIGDKKEDGGLLNVLYAQLPDKANYPAIAQKAYDNAAGSYVLGDVNGDFLIDATDASKILVEYSLFSTGKEPTLSETLQKAANVNSDTMIDATDATAVLVYYSRMSTGGTQTLKQTLCK